jgi:hypothetical protein
MAFTDERGRELDDLAEELAIDIDLAELRGVDVDVDKLARYVLRLVKIVKEVNSDD